MLAEMSYTNELNCNNSVALASKILMNDLYMTKKRKHVIELSPFGIKLEDGDDECECR